MADSPKSSDSTFIRQILVTGFLMLILFGIAFLIAYQGERNKKSGDTLASNYDECTNSAGSIIQESYPPVCVTKDGKRFTQTVEDNQEGKFCGGIVNIACPEGYTCRLDGDYPDAGGKCVKN